MCYSEDKKCSRGQDKGESWEKKACRGEEEEKIDGVPLATLGQSTGRECCSFKEY